jgi:hypothetical protein
MASSLGGVRLLGRSRDDEASQETSEAVRNLERALAGFSFDATSPSGATRREAGERHHPARSSGAETGMPEGRGMRSE